MSTFASFYLFGYLFSGPFCVGSQGNSIIFLWGFPKCTVLCILFCVVQGHWTVLVARFVMLLSLLWFYPSVMGC
ncbi:hypothetical protein E2C01_057536 [Portunus trituberculatus]|uniref:Uncharacterized protein n=1 Tax=Portunus trituberculatus TaxID=210409 RepID=A0A5B7H2V3_PORTR|nr:hypothetical protein [Portunus trituberculatus]